MAHFLLNTEGQLETATLWGLDPDLAPEDDPGLTITGEAFSAVFLDKIDIWSTPGWTPARTFPATVVTGSRSAWDRVFQTLKPGSQQMKDLAAFFANNAARLENELSIVNDAPSAPLHSTCEPAELRYEKHYEGAYDGWSYGAGWQVLDGWQ